MSKRRGHQPKGAQAAWRKMRANHLAVYPECRICGDTENVVVHHLRYRGKRGESEKPGDLMTLCAFHHDRYHQRVGRGKTTPASTLAYVQEERLRGDACESCGSPAPVGGARCDVCGVAA